MLVKVGGPHYCEVMYWYSLSIYQIYQSLQVHWSSPKSVAEDNDQLPKLVMTFTVRHGFSMALIEIDGKHRS